MFMKNYKLHSLFIQIFENVPEDECPVTTETQPVLPFAPNLIKETVEQLLNSPIVEVIFHILIPSFLIHSLCTL